MRKNKFPLESKIDFLYGFSILFIIVSAFYAYRYISNLTSLSDQAFDSIQMKDGLVVAAVLILTSLLILTAFYLKIRYDVKVRNKKEAELVSKLEELELINKNNKKLFSVIAHDLRSPFHPILMIAEILMAGGEDVEKEEIVFL